MKKDLHPSEYRPVVYNDINADFAFLTQSTAETDETIKWTDGKTYPLVKVHISSASHPFYTGQEKLLDVEGRVDRFKARQEQAQKRADALAGKAKKEQAKAAKKAEQQAQKDQEAAAKMAAIKPARKPKANKPKPEAKVSEKPAEEQVAKPEQQTENDDK